MAVKKSAQSGLADRFSLASDAVKHRTIMSVTGEIGAGKSYFTMTAPGPILIQNIDKGTEGVVEQFRQEGKDIYDEHYDWNPGVTGDDGEVDDKELQDKAIEVRNKWEKDFRYAVKNGIRSITWDTESRYWQCHRYAEFGAPNADNVRDYDVLNQRFESLINEAKACDINLFLIRSMKDHWGLVGGVNAKTGKKAFGKSGREVWGYEHLPGIVFTELFFSHDKEAGEYVIDVGKCRHSKNLQYTTVPRCSFPELGTLMVEGSSEEEWS